MKSRKFIPDYFLVLGMVVMPIACSLNLGVATCLLGQRTVSFIGEAILIGAFFGLLLCFPLGIASSKTLKLWQMGQSLKARAWGIACGSFAILCLWPYIVPLKRPIALIQKALMPGGRGEMEREILLTFALLAIPIFWALLLIVIPLLARAPAPVSRQE